MTPKNGTEAYPSRLEGGAMMARCTVCRRDEGPMMALGGTLLCRECVLAVREEMERLRAEGKAVNVPAIARRLSREDASVIYLLRDIPKELWTRAKHKAVDENISLRELIIRALEAYLR
jgi:hypothetical protein